MWIRYADQTRSSILVRDFVLIRKEGMSVKLLSNYVRMTGAWKTFVALYDVQFLPDEPNSRFRREFVEKLMEKEGISKVASIHNGRSLLFMRGEDAGRLPQGKFPVLILVVKYDLFLNRLLIVSPEREYLKVSKSQ